MNKKHLKIIYSLETPFPPLMANPPPKEECHSAIQQIIKTNQAEWIHFPSKLGRFNSMAQIQKTTT